VRRLERRLDFRPPLLPDNLFGHLAATAVPGVEEWRDGAYRCSVSLQHGTGILALRPGSDHPDHPHHPDHPDHVAATFWLDDERDAQGAEALSRFVLDLDADPAEIDDRLSDDPVLAPLVAAAPGRRVPRTSDPEQFAIRAVLGQQISTAAARTHAARLVASHGRPLDDPDGGLTHLFPTPEDLVDLDPESLAMPRSRRTTLLGLLDALRTGAVELTIGGDAERSLAQLGALRGIGPWTVGTVAMRALGDRDAWIPSDLGIRFAAAALGLPDKDRDLTAHAEVWRPYRAYAVQHLWGTGEHAVNRMPG
jgi:AraC family transcriptional regulator of adaptative response / DNA-3-methyladenine glycosylase II